MKILKPMAILVTGVVSILGFGQEIAAMGSASMVSQVAAKAVTLNSMSDAFKVSLNHDPLVSVSTVDSNGTPKVTTYTVNNVKNGRVYFVTEYGFPSVGEQVAISAIRHNDDGTIVDISANGVVGQDDKDNIFVTLSGLRVQTITPNDNTMQATDYRSSTIGKWTTQTTTAELSPDAMQDIVGSNTQI